MQVARIFHEQAGGLGACRRGIQHESTEVDRIFGNREVAGENNRARPLHVRSLVDVGRAPVKDVQLDLSRCAGLAVALDFTEADSNGFVFLRIEVPVHVDPYIDRSGVGRDYDNILARGVVVAARGRPRILKWYQQASWRRRFSLYGNGYGLICGFLDVRGSG